MHSESSGPYGPLRGEYKAIESPQQLVSSHINVYQYRSDRYYSESTNELEEVEGKAEMTFTKIGFEKRESRDSHEEDWVEKSISLNYN